MKSILRTLAALSALCLLACDIPFDNDIKTFLEEQTGTIALKQVAPAPGALAVGTDGYICLASGENSFTLPIDNPLGYALVVESSFEQNIGTGISNVEVNQTDINSLTVSIPTGDIEGNEGTLHIKIKTAKEGRILYEGDINLAFVSFDTSLAGITLSDSLILNPVFNAIPASSNYSISGAPNAFTLTAKPTDTTGNAFVTINNMTGMGVPGLTTTITPNADISEVLIEVYTAHKAAYRNYHIVVNRAGAGTPSLVLVSPPSKLYYSEVRTAVNTGLVTAGMDITYGGVSPDISQFTLDYDFTTPGQKTVTVSYNSNPSLTVAFQAWVVGLTGLTVTGPGVSASELTFNHSTTTAYDLGTHSFTTDYLDITATSSIAEVTGASLTIKLNSGTAVTATSGTAKRIVIPSGSSPNTITITVAKGSVSRAYSITIIRPSLNDGAELYVSQTGDNDSGNGSSSAPYATVKKALDIIKTSGLNQTHEVTIAISGTITADIGTSNGMVDISGSGYPKIILEGKGTADAGTIDATGKSKRVLYIAGGNKVTLGENLTLTGGNTTTYGGGV
jgi:hypothetical protein